MRPVWSDRASTSFPPRSPMIPSNDVTWALSASWTLPAPSATVAAASLASATKRRVICEASVSNRSSEAEAACSIWDWVAAP